MSTLYLAAVLLCAPPTTDAAESVSTDVVVLSARELREVFREAVRTSYQGKPQEAVPKLVSSFKALERDKKLSNVERADLKNRLRSRMIAMGDKIVDEARREMKKRQREEAKKGSAAGGDKAGSVAGGYAVGDSGTGGSTPLGAAGGAGQDDSDELIELIRRTIRPESWDVNGGPGTIMYYRPALALVISQTEEVHWLIGGLSGALRQ
jgi:hypothetical protein